MESGSVKLKKKNEKINEEDFSFQIFSSFSGMIKVRFFTELFSKQRSTLHKSKSLIPHPPVLFKLINPANFIIHPFLHKTRFVTILPFQVATIIGPAFQITGKSLLNPNPNPNPNP